MDKSEYEQICEAAFGKDKGKSRILTVLKDRKLVFWKIAAAVIVCIVLLVLLWPEKSAYVHRDIPKPVWLQIESKGEKGFTGMDIYGNRWNVSCDMGALDEYSSRCWVSFEGKTYPVINGAQIEHTVTAEKCWNKIESDKAKYGYADSICEFDIDRDGTVEQCILAVDMALSYLTYQLYIWDGDTCELAVAFNPKCQYLAFYTEGEELKITGIDNVSAGGGSVYNMEILYDIIYENGKLSLLEDGEALELRDAS